MYDIINIDSRQRNTNNYNKSSKFSVFLSNPLKKIKCIELLSIEIPISYNNITNTNNTLVINENNNTAVNIIITVPIGTYTMTSFITSLQTLLNSNTLNSYIYTVSYNSSSNIFNIICSGTFLINSLTTCNKIIGYDGNNTLFTNNWSSTNSCDITFEKYLFVKLNNIPFLTRNSDNNYFAKIQIPTNSNTILYNGVNASYPMKRYINNDDFILNKIDVELVFYDDVAVDLKGLDWSFTLNIQFEE